MQFYRFYPIDSLRGKIAADRLPSVYPVCCNFIHDYSMSYWGVIGMVTQVIGDWRFHTGINLDECFQLENVDSRCQVGFSPRQCRELGLLDP